MRSGRYDILSFREILDWPGAFLHEHLRSLLTIGTCATLLTALPNLVITPLSLRAQNPAQPLELSQVGLIYGALAVTLLIGPIAWLAIFRTVGELIQGRSIGVGRALVFALHPLRYLALLLVVLICGTASMCFCLPGLIVIPLFSFVPAIIATEDEHFGSYAPSIQLATYLAPGNSLGELPALRVLLLWLLYYGLNAGLTSFASVPQMIYSGFQGFRLASSGELPGPPSLTWLIVILGSQLMATVFQAVANVYIATCVTVMYRNMRHMRDADDLIEAINAQAATGTGA